MEERFSLNTLRVLDSLPAEEQHFIWFQLDPIGHHVVVERCSGGGWRVYQSHITNQHTRIGYAHGYSARQWVTSAPIPGHQGAHAAFGQGKVLDLQGILSFASVILLLQKLTEDVLRDDALLDQLPLKKPPRTFPHPSWAEYHGTLKTWTNGINANLDVLGLTRAWDADALYIYQGQTRLFRVAKERAERLEEAYTKLTGEDMQPSSWFKIVEFAIPSKCPETFNPVGWTIAMGRAN